MKALTLWEPWASLMAWGEKRIETRHWPTSHRGLVAIHAAKRFGPEEYGCLLDPDDPIAEAFARHASAGQSGIWWVQANTLGRVLAVGRLVDCLPTTILPEGVPTRSPWVPPAGSPEHDFGDFSPRRWMWVFADVVRLPEPPLVRGAQGLWEWEPPAGLLDSLGIGAGRQLAGVGR